MDSGNNKDGTKPSNVLTTNRKRNRQLKPSSCSPKQKTNRSSNISSPKKLNRWTTEEKSVLVHLVEQYGDDWGAIVDSMNESFGNNRTAKSCQSCYMRCQAFGFEESSKTFQDAQTQTDSYVLDGHFSRKNIMIHKEEHKRPNTKDRKEEHKKDTDHDYTSQNLKSKGKDNERNIEYYKENKTWYGNINLKCFTDSDTVSVEETIMEVVADEIKGVSTKTEGSQSLLLADKSISYLEENCDKIFMNIIKEMSERTPLLLGILLKIFSKTVREKEEKIVGAISTIYSIILFTKNAEISALQRLLTALCIRGRAEDMLFNRLNKIGLTLCARSKQRIVEEASTSGSTDIVTYLETNPLLKITGDNLDVFIRTGNLSVTNRNTDLHLFASNAISSRISTPDMDSAKPIIDLDKINVNDVLLTTEEKDKLKSSYIIHVCKILSATKSFEWMAPLLDKHTKHPYSKAMGKKSLVAQLPIVNKNEAKYEECLEIMDELESNLHKLFNEAHGDCDALDRFRVVVGGDQLTRERFAGAVNLRSLSTTPTQRLDHLNPIVCELWHMKQDFVEKCYKTLYNANSAQEVGTLAFFKNLLLKNNVTGKVKGKFESHSQFLKLITESLVREMASEIFSLDNLEIVPTFLLNVTALDKMEQREIMMEIGDLILSRLEILQDKPPDKCGSLRNYCNNICSWGLHLFQLDDTAKEGDITSVIPNLKMTIPFFYSHSSLSKYLVEAINYIVQVEHLLSPLNRMRVLEGSFVNTKGGVGQNIEADLAQEHSVRDQKELIKGLGANKSENAIRTVCAAAPAINNICKLFDASMEVKAPSTKHASKIKADDVSLVQKKLRKIRPFKPGDSCLKTFPYVKSNQRQQVNVELMKKDIDVIVNRVKKGKILYYDDEEEEEEEMDEEDIENEI